MKTPSERLAKLRRVAAVLKRHKIPFNYDWGNWEVEDDDRTSICSLSGLDDANGGSVSGDPGIGEFIALAANEIDWLLDRMEKLERVAEAGEAWAKECREDIGHDKVNLTWLVQNLAALKENS